MGGACPLLVLLCSGPGRGGVSCNPPVLLFGGGIVLLFGG